MLEPAKMLLSSSGTPRSYTDLGEATAPAWEMEIEDQEDQQSPNLVVFWLSEVCIGP